MRTRRWHVAAGAVLAVYLLVVGTTVPALALSDARAEVCADAVAGAFEDVAPEGTHAGNIDCIAVLRITSGVGDGRYRPAGTVSRGQMATFLVNLVAMATDTDFEPPAAPPRFGDVGGTVHERNILIAAELRITSGRTAATFEPSLPVTRAQMATFVVQAIEAAGGVLDRRARDAFIDDDGSVHEQNINAAAAARIVLGIGNGRFDPEGEVTRAQMATFLTNAVAFLHTQDRWGPTRPVIEGPEIDEVMRSESGSARSVEVVWDRPVTLVGESVDFALYDASDEVQVATGQLVTASETQVTVEFDVEPESNRIYHLRVEAGAVEDDDGGPNQAQSVVFYFPEIDGDGRDDGDDAPAISLLRVDGIVVASGDSIITNNAHPMLSGEVELAGDELRNVSYRLANDIEWSDANISSDSASSSIIEFTSRMPELSTGSHTVQVQATSKTNRSSRVIEFSIQVAGAEVSEVLINSVETEALANRLRLEFSQAVVCNDSPNAAAAWSFVNASASADAAAYGAPDAVMQVESPSTECFLEYRSTGVSSSDFGYLSYSQPFDEAARIVSSSGARLNSQSAVQVKDTAAPDFASIVGNPAASTIELVFDKPVLCESLVVGSLDVKVNYKTVNILGYLCPGVASSTPTLQLESGSFRGADLLAVETSQPIRSESGFTILAPGVRRIAVSPE